MAKSSGSYLINTIDRLLIGSTSGIKGVRYDISEKEAQELIIQLQDETRNAKPPEEMNPWERPGRPTNLLVLTLMALKEDPMSASLTIRRRFGIPDSQYLTEAETKEVAKLLLKQPTIPGKEEELKNALDALPQDFTWARRIR